MSAEDQRNPDVSDFFDASKPPPEPSDEAQQQAWTEANAGALALQQQGHYVRTSRRASQAHRPAAGSGLVVLVVEDDLAFSILLKNLLGLQGFLPRTARNRAEVIAGLMQVPAPDLVLLDVGLPDANGFDILLRMKQHPTLKTIPVIMLTGETTREAVMQGLAGGADGYVSKPFELDNLLHAVRAVLS